MVLSTDSWESCRVHRSSCALCTWNTVAASFPLSPSSWALTASTDILKPCDESQGNERTMIGTFWWFPPPPIITFLNQEVHFWTWENQITDPVCTVGVLSWIWAALVHFIHGFFFFSINTYYVIRTMKLTCRCQAMGRVGIADPLLVRGSISFMLGAEFGCLLWCSSHFGNFFPLVHFVLYSFMWTFFLNQFHWIVIYIK